MGQYYYAVNLTRHEYIKPHAFGDGAKLMEFACSAPSMMAGLAILLADGNGRGGGDLDTESRLAKKIIGRWAGDRIVITGDYADEGKFLDGIKSAKANLYTYVDENFKDISDDVIEVLCADVYAAERLLTSAGIRERMITRGVKAAQVEDAKYRLGFKSEGGAA